MEPSILSLGITAVILYVIIRAYKIYHALKIARRDGIPVYIVAIQADTPLAIIIPTWRWIHGLRYYWEKKDTIYKERGSEVFYTVPLITGNAILSTSSPELFKQIYSYESTFEKNERSEKNMSFLGANVIASHGDLWRRHRRVTAPAFNNTTFRNVWIQTARIYDEMIKVEGWSHVDTFHSMSSNDITTKVALLVISACGFGIPLPWSDPPGTSKDMSERETIVAIANNVLPRILIPRWAYYLPIPRVQHVEKAYTHFEQFMRQHISTRKSEIKKDLALSKIGVNSEATKDVFGCLVHASETDEGIGLSDSELVGNYFIFMFAGHETTAQTMVMTLALLALHQDEQDIIVDSIAEAVESGHDFSLDDNPLFSSVLAAFYEANRLYPPGYVLLTEATEDTTFTYPSTRYTGTETITIPSGTPVILDMIGANRNPRHFPEPEKFKPSRWYESVESFLGFSYGPRVCLGRKFATTEATCFLAHMLRDWKVEVIRREGESNREWEKRVLVPSFAITLRMKNVPLRFTRRNL